jgi:hypothetical protein
VKLKVVPVLTAAMLCFNSTVYGAATINSTINAPILTSAPTESELPAPLQNYAMFSGTIYKIKDPSDAQASMFNQVIFAKNADGGEVAFLIGENTYFVTDTKPAVGEKIIGFYDAKKPMTLIYPPQPQADVIAINLPDSKTVKVDIFDKDLVSADGQLKLTLGDKTDIMLQNGEKFDGELANRRLAVVYGASTRSIPAQTTPDKVVVLYETAVHPSYQLTEEDKAMLKKDYATMKITVNDKEVNATPYVDTTGVPLLPIRSIAEAAGLDIEWLAASKSVAVGKIATFTVGKDSYSTINKTELISLGAAPIIVRDRTYVPFEFFSEIMSAEVSIEYKTIKIQFAID